MEPITDLKDEHRGVETMLGIIENVAGKFAQGRDVNTKDLDAILEFLTVFVDRCHHGKEEEFLFSALEAAGVPRDQGPIGVLLHEHEQGRQLVAELRQALDELLSGDREASKAIQRKEEKLSLIVPTPEDGFQLAIALARKGVTETQPDKEVLKKLRPTYAHDPDSLIAASQVIAIHFQTMLGFSDNSRQAKGTPTRGRHHYIQCFRV